jgi:hypothetical protein
MRRVPFALAISGVTGLGGFGCGPDAVMVAASRQRALSLENGGPVMSAVRSPVSRPIGQARLIEEDTANLDAGGFFMAMH